MCDPSGGDMPMIEMPGTRSTPSQSGLITSANSTFGAGSIYRPESNPLILQQESGGRMSGSDNMAKIHRAQWEDYRSRFAPVEDMVFDRFQDTGRTDDAVKSAGVTMAGAFDRSQEQTARELSRYGVTESGDTKAANNRTYGLKKAASVAGAKNAMRTAMEDQKMGVMTGGLSTINSQRSN